jgi:hypothetical protein
MNNLKLSMLAMASVVVTHSASAIEITDYKVIEGTYSDAYIDGSLNINNDSDKDQTSYNAVVKADLESVHTTAPYTLEYMLRGQGSSIRGSGENDTRETQYNTTAEIEVNKYINNDDTYFIYGNTKLGYQKLSTTSKASDPFVKIGAGTGYGRMYIATPLANAMRIAEDLKEYKIIKASITDKALMALAKIIGLESEYASKYGANEYRQYWYSDMEKVLKANEALSNGTLSATGIVRLNEILSTNDSRGVLDRLHGWTVQAGAGQILSDYNGKDGDTTIDAEFDYALPFGYTSQLRETLHASKVLDSDSAFDYTMGNNLKYTYEISDKVDWINTWNLQYLKANNSGDNVTTNVLGTTFRYYLANQLTFNTTLSLSNVDGNNLGFSETKGWNTALISSVSYRLK